MDHQTELLNRHQDLLEGERVFNNLLRRLGATSIPTSVRATSEHRHTNSLTVLPLDLPPSQKDLLERTASGL